MPKTEPFEKHSDAHDEWFEKNRDLYEMKLANNPPALIFHGSRIAFSQAIPIINIADSMQQRYNHTPGDRFFKNEGHLTPEGHRVVAGLTRQWLSENKKTDSN